MPMLMGFPFMVGVRVIMAAVFFVGGVGMVMIAALAMGMVMAVLMAVRVGMAVRVLVLVTLLAVPVVVAMGMAVGVCVAVVVLVFAAGHGVPPLLGNLQSGRALRPGVTAGRLKSPYPFDHGTGGMIRQRLHPGVVPQAVPGTVTLRLGPQRWARPLPVGHPYGLAGDTLVNFVLSG